MLANSILLFSNFSDFSNNKLFKKKASKAFRATSLVDFYRKDFSFLDLVQGYIRKSYVLYLGSKSTNDRNFRLRPNKKRFLEKMASRDLDIILVYIRVKRRNTFTAVARWEHVQHNLPEYVLLQKFSAGLVGYFNNKKHTRMAQEAVASSTGEYVKEQEGTFVDIVFPTKMSIRTHIRILKNMIQARFFVRYIIGVKRRNYGIHRGKKARRV